MIDKRYELRSCALLCKALAKRILYGGKEGLTHRTLRLSPTKENVMRGGRALQPIAKHGGMHDNPFFNPHFLLLRKTWENLILAFLSEPKGTGFKQFQPTHTPFAKRRHSQTFADIFIYRCRRVCITHLQSSCIVHTPSGGKQEVDKHAFYPLPRSGIFDACMDIKLIRKGSA